MTSDTSRSAPVVDAGTSPRVRVLQAVAAEVQAVGYRAATVRRIARRAQVPVDVVEAEGPRPELLVRAFELVFAGAQSGRTLGEAVTAALPDVRDARVLLRTATAYVADAYARSVRLWEAFVVAAGADPDVHAEYVAMCERRRADMRGLLALLTARGVTRPFDLEHVLDVVELLYSHESWRRLAEDRGWSRERWVDWTTASTLAVLGGALPRA